MIDIKFKGLREAIRYFTELSENIRDSGMQGLEDAAELVFFSIQETVPHKGTHLPTFGACYHTRDTFNIIPEPENMLVRCGPEVPYVKILEYGSTMTEQEFPRNPGRIRGQIMWYKGIRDIFYWPRKYHQTGVPAFRYLAKSIEKIVPDRIREIMMDWIKAGVRFE